MTLQRDGRVILYSVKYLFAVALRVELSRMSIAKRREASVSEAVRPQQQYQVRSTTRNQFTPKPSLSLCAVRFVELLFGRKLLAVASIWHEQLACCTALR